MKRIVNALIDILIVCILLFSILVLSLSLTSKKNGVPSFFGYTIFTVQTDSMEPVINVGDLMVSEITDSGREFQIGDIITFTAYYENTSYLNTHRIVEINEVDGVKYYTTKGDNASAEDANSMVAGDIVAIWNGFKIAKIGKVIDYLQTKTGFFLCVLLPMIVFFLYSLFTFVRDLIDYNKANAIEAAQEAAQEAAAALTEQQKQAVIQEYLNNRHDSSK